MKKTLFILLATIVFQGCNEVDKNKNITTIVAHETTKSISKDDDYTKKEICIYNVAKESDLYAEPNEKSSKLINQKATNIFGEVHYLSIDNSCKVKIIETNADWSKIQVVDPYWLKETHIGWVKTDVIKVVTDNHKDEYNYQENKDYQILYSKKNGQVTNHHILTLWKDFDETKLEQLANCIKEGKFSSSSCNIYIYDSKDIINSIDKYPLKGKEYVNFADHFVFMLSFDGMTMYYPYKDVLYKEYGGKNPIR